MSSNKRILIVFSDKATRHLLQRNILAPGGFQVIPAENCAQAERLVRSATPDLVILGDQLEDGHHLELAERLFKSQPMLPIILFTSDSAADPPLKVLRLGVVDWLKAPLHADKVLEAIKRGLARRQTWQEWLKTETKTYTGPLQERLDELEALAQISRAVTAHLDLDRVLTTVVDAAVKQTGAEEGSILLLDETSGELYVRAARNFQDEDVRTFRLPIKDSLAGQVVETGEPVFLSGKDQKKIKTSYLVYSLIYVPLKVHDRIIGVLGVDNRQTKTALHPRHVTLLAAMADYATIAIENARLYTQSEIERHKLESILTQVEDGVLITDTDEHVILANGMVRKIFGLGEEDLSSQPLEETIEHEGLIDALRGEVENPDQIEIEIKGGRVCSVQVTEIAGIGKVATLHDITYLKELDRIKSDFVNAVSHDLRSPLTAILGYVELIGRVGPVNEQQADFIQRVQFSVHNITNLINNLLNLGRLEVGLDIDFETVPLSPIVTYAVDGVQQQVNEKRQTLDVEYPDNLPHVIGNPIQLRQLLDNLLNNAIKYTPVGGEVRLVSSEENGQIIIEVHDNGQGIPAEDQPRIFEKFYRGSNVAADVQGTGLGLAIVKTIVDNHRGRIWVESKVGEGSTFTVVLPVASKEENK